jgi:hypothetical protein
VTLEVRGAPPTTVVWEKWGQKGQVVSRVPRCSNSFLLHDVNHTPHIFNCAPTSISHACWHTCTLATAVTTYSM